jgi:hypothetical protein
MSGDDEVNENRVADKMKKLAVKARLEKDFLFRVLEQALTPAPQLRQDYAAFRRVRAALRACRESALCDAAECGSRLSAANLLRERLEDDEVDFFLRLWPLR